MSGVANLCDLVDQRRLILTVGAGGVGKTTVSAAMGVAAVMAQPGRCLVLTVDPARRLADALKLQVGDVPTRVPDAALKGAGVHVAGELWVSMLDTASGWIDLVRRHAPDEKTASEILDNRLFKNLTSRFVQSHGYLAMERLWQVAQEFDVVIIDTPPSRNALDILDAPNKMAEFFGSGLLRWLTAPYRSRLVSAASRPFNMVADRILGDRFLSDIGEFFALFQRLGPTFVAHAREVETLLRADAGFVVVTTLETSRVNEALYLFDQVGEHAYEPLAIIANRTMDPALGSRSVVEAANALVADRAESRLSRLSGAVADPAVGDPGVVGDPREVPNLEPTELAATLRALADQAPTLIELARRERHETERISTRTPIGTPTIRLPLLGGGIDGIDVLVSLATKADTVAP